MMIRTVAFCIATLMSMTAIAQDRAAYDLMKDPAGKVSLPAEAKGGCTEDVWVDVTIDDFGNAITWQIIRISDNSIAAQGGPYPNGSGGNTVSIYTCLDKDCYRFVLLDDDGNGIDQGGYLLRDFYGNRIIVADGEFGSQSAIALNGEFCLPLSNQKLIDSWCDKLDLEYDSHTQIYASNQPGATGYQFWMYDPHGTYYRKVFRTTQNLWPTHLVTLPVPADLDLNVKVRALINGQYTNYGRACVIRLNSVVPPSPRSAPIASDTEASLSLFPNPGRRSEVRLHLEGLPLEGGIAAVDIVDLAGRTVTSSTLAHEGARSDAFLPGSEDLRTGTYVVRVRAGDLTLTDRLVVF